MTNRDEIIRELKIELAALEARLEKKNSLVLVLREQLGLSTGEVVAGNIGSEMRVKYSVIGRTVNLTARIEGIASGGQVLPPVPRLTRSVTLSARLES